MTSHRSVWKWNGPFDTVRTEEDLPLRQRRSAVPPGDRCRGRDLAGGVEVDKGPDVPRDRGVVGAARRVEALQQMPLPSSNSVLVKGGAGTAAGSRRRSCIPATSFRRRSSRLPSSGRGIVVEDLTGIRGRIKATCSQRSCIPGHSGSCCSLSSTNRKPRRRARAVCRCPRREPGFLVLRHRWNRSDQATFSCISCAHSQPADRNATGMMRARASVTKPECSSAFSAA